MIISASSSVRNGKIYRDLEQICDGADHQKASYLKNLLDQHSRQINPYWFLIGVLTSHIPTMNNLTQLQFDYSPTVFPSNSIVGTCGLNARSFAIKSFKNSISLLRGNINPPNCESFSSTPFGILKSLTSV